MDLAPASKSMYAMAGPDVAPDGTAERSTFSIDVRADQPHHQKPPHARLSSNRTAKPAQVRVAVYSPDSLTTAGLSGALSAEAGFEVVEGPLPSDVDVRIVATYHLTPEILTLLRRAAPTGVPVVLVVNEITGPQLLVVIECRVVAVLSRQLATGERLAHTVRTAAAGGGVLPPALLGEVLKHLERLQREVLEPHGLNAAGLNPREIEILRLMAEGMDTAEIAGKLCYSVRTVKNVIAGFTKRLNLRNRSHAVVYAMHRGMI